MTNFKVSIFGDSLTDVKNHIRTHIPEPICLESMETGDQVQFVSMYTKDLFDAYNTLVLLGLEKLGVTK